MKTTSSLNLWQKQGLNAGRLVAGVCLISSLLLAAQETAKVAEDTKHPTL